MRKRSVPQMCVIALAAVLNIVGGNIALMLRLPIYLDSVGTMLAAALFGPVCGMIPGIASAVISGVTTDVYAFYFLPVQLVIGFVTGIAYRIWKPGNWREMWKIIPAALMISIPGTIVSSAITALVFGGITSSGSTVLVQLLHGMGIDMTASVCIVQGITDLADRVVSLCLTAVMVSALPVSWRLIGKGEKHGTL